NEKFAQHDPKGYPNVWSQTVVPPPSYYSKQKDGYKVSYPGILVEGKWQLSPVYPPISMESGYRLANYPPSFTNITTEGDAVKFVNDNAGTYYPRHDGDNRYTYFINSGSNPREDGLSYEHRVRGAFFIVNGNRWDGIRYVGMNFRNGVSGTPVLLRDVEIFFGAIHNLIMKQGRFENVVSATPPAREGLWFYQATAFHAHGSAAGGLVYDRCLARNTGIAFYDHNRDAKRPFTVMRDCVTENAKGIFTQGHSSGVYCSEQGFITGHRHQYPDAKPMGFLGYMAGRNFVEDSLFRFRPEGSGSWHPSNAHLRMRNSVIYTTPGPLMHSLPKGVDYEYEYVTLIVDFGGKEITDQSGRIDSGGRAAGEEKLGTIKLKNSIIAVINAPNMKASREGAGVAARLFPSGRALPGADYIFENCVMTYIAGIPQESGVEGKDYIFAPADKIFAGKPADGDYTVKTGGPAESKDAGYRPGRKPVFRPIADKLAAELPF
ncbi:MAG: hypothetical protein Q8O57_09560, partial [Kiritimatiellota bacterium]|nr:hypothetical protein [Kiritimatiellota bacterium]